MSTVFSLKDPNPGAWFKFDEEDPESGEISVRAVNQAKRKDIQNKTVKRKVEYKHGQRFEFQDSNEDLFSELLWDYVIADWKGLEDDDGKPIECTTANKIFLMQNNVGFAAFVGKCMELVNDGIEERVKVTEKNSKSTLSDSGKSPTVKRSKS